MKKSLKIIGVIIGVAAVVAVLYFNVLGGN